MNQRTLAIAVVIACWMPVAPLSAAPLRHYHGTGENVTLNVDFILMITLDVSAAPTISGEFDATGLPGGTVICGKGSYTGTLTGNAISFSFFSSDDDPGCGGGTTISVNATLSASGQALTGTYTTGTGHQGTLDTRLADRWTGTGFNDPFSAPWLAEVYLAYLSPSIIAGSLDATEAPGDQTICGRGIFVGTRTGSTVDFEFTSNDPDPGCGFDFGAVNTFTGEVSPDGIQMTGSYLIDNGQDGTWSVTKEGIFADGFESANVAQWSAAVP